MFTRSRRFALGSILMLLPLLAGASATTRPTTSPADSVAMTPTTLPARLPATRPAAAQAARPATPAATPVAPPVAKAAPKPAAGAKTKRVLIISVDGLRPDLLLRGNTPTLHGLLDQGAYTFWAQTTAVSVTIPSHVSMLTGARPTVHRIEWNMDLPLSGPVYPAVPTLLELAKKAGYTTGLVAGKSKFDVFLKPGTVDRAWITPSEVVSNREVLSAVLTMFKEDVPQVMMVHLPETDRVGHAVGWASKPYMAALHGADTAIGTILGTLASRQLLEQTLVIVTSDHGGAGRTHGPDDARSRHIPWICVGPGVRVGADLTGVAPNRLVRTEDTFATAAHFLGIAVDANLDGRPVLEAMDRSGEELLTDATAPAAAK